MFTMFVNLILLIVCLNPYLCFLSSISLLLSALSLKQFTNQTSSLNFPSCKLNCCVLHSCSFHYGCLPPLLHSRKEISYWILKFYIQIFFNFVIEIAISFDCSSHATHLFDVDFSHMTIFVCHHELSLKQALSENKVVSQIEEEAIWLTIWGLLGGKFVVGRFSTDNHLLMVYMEMKSSGNSSKGSRRIYFLVGSGRLKEAHNMLDLLWQIFVYLT